MSAITPKTRAALESLVARNYALGLGIVTLMDETLPRMLEELDGQMNIALKLLGEENLNELLEVRQAEVDRVEASFREEPQPEAVQ